MGSKHLRLYIIASRCCTCSVNSSELAPAFERASGHHVDLAQRDLLRAATSIASSDSGSGTFLATVLFPQLGIAEQVAATAAREE
jgi:hypothetical protein